MFRILRWLLLVPAAYFVPGIPGRAAEAPDCPLSLHGFFGQGDGIEASFREDSTGRSVWLKPGDKSSGWTLDKIDRPRNAVVLVSGDRRLELRLAGEVPPMPPFDPLKDSIAMRRLFATFHRKRGSALKYGQLVESATSVVKSSHPDWFDEKTGEPNPEYGRDAGIAMGRNYLELLKKSTDPDVMLFRDAEIASTSTRLDMPPDEKIDAAFETLRNNPADRTANDIMNAYNWKLSAEADRRYLAAGGTTSFDDLPPEPPPVKDDE